MKKLIFLMGVVCLISSSSIGQTWQPINKVHVLLSLANSDSTINWNDTTFSAVSLIQCKAYAFLSDTIAIDSVFVKLGSTAGGSEYLAKAFDYNIHDEFTDGTTFSRKGTLMKLGLGEYQALNLYCIEVWAKDINGILSPAVIRSKL